MRVCLKTRRDAAAADARRGARTPAEASSDQPSHSNRNPVLHPLQMCLIAPLVRKGRGKTVTFFQCLLRM
jgi:hypothetical protein